VRLVLQRVSEASVSVDGRVVSEIGRGLLILVGVAVADEGSADDAAERLADKVANLRIFADGAGKMNLAMTEAGGAALVVSQFTLYADTKKGRRPSWMEAARPEVAEPAVETFARALEARGARVGRGIFGADMQVALVNDGPVTILLDG